VLRVDALPGTRPIERRRIVEMHPYRRVIAADGGHSSCPKRSVANRRRNAGSSASSSTMNGTRPAARIVAMVRSRASGGMPSHAIVSRPPVEPQTAALLHRQHDGVRRERTRRVAAGDREPRFERLEIERVARARLVQVPRGEDEAQPRRDSHAAGS